MLKEKFKQSPYPTKEEYEELSRYLNTSTKRIQTWFYDQHRKIKKQQQHSHHPEEYVTKTGQELGQEQMSHITFTRQQFSKQQRLILKEAFETTGGKVPDKIQMESLINKLKVDNVIRIKRWFTRERAHLRRKETSEASSPCKQSH